MVYDTKNRRLILKNGKTVENITENEHRFILVMGNNLFNSIEELAKEIYKNNDKQIKYKKQCITLLKSRLLKKVKLKIINKSGYGYKLENEISFI